MTLKAKVARMDGDQVLVVFEDGQKLTVARSSIEGSVLVGQEVALILAIPGGEDAARSRMAQDVLNELLRPADSA